MFTGNRMTDTFSLLQTINQKEREIRDRIEQAHQRAKTLIQAAHKEAEQTVAQADREAQSEAEALYQQGLEKAHKEAEGLVMAARDQAARLNRQAIIRLEEAAQQVMALVLPPNFPPMDQLKAETDNKQYGLISE